MTGRHFSWFSGTASKRSIAIILVGSLLFIGLLVGAIFLMAKKNDASDSPLPVSSLDLFSGTQAPSPQPSASPAATAGVSPDELNSASHVVRFGDTLSGIASLYEVDITAIEAANSLSAEMIQPNQRIVIPLTEDHQRFTHVIQYGQTISSIANLYQIPPLLIEAANGITDPNAITAGQRLVIVRRPSDPEIELAVDALLTEIATRLGEIPERPEWPRSLLLNGEVGNYPISIEEDGFTLHTQPGTHGEARSGEIAGWVDAMLPKISSALSATEIPHIDIFIAGTPYASPYMALRGTVDFEANAIWFLDDGTGTSEEQRIFLATKLARLIAFQSWGDPSSPLFAEGVAQMLGWQVAGDDVMTAQADSCRLLHEGGLLPQPADLVVDPFYFASIVYDHPAYSAAGCFSAYIAETEGFPLLREFYLGHYGAGPGLDELKSGWQDSLGPLPTETQTDLADAYDLFTQAKTTETLIYDGSESTYLAYFVLDRARTALWQGDLDSFNAWLADFLALTGFTPELGE